MSKLRDILASEGLTKGASIEDHFDVWKATDGMWYALVLEDKSYNPDDEDANWGSSAEPEFRVAGREGPEGSEDAILRELRRRHGNMATKVDKSGRRAPGKPVDKSWRLFARTLSPDAAAIMETLDRLGKAEHLTSVGDTHSFRVALGPTKHLLLDGLVKDEKFHFSMSLTDRKTGVIDVSNEPEVQTEGAADIRSLMR